LRSGSQATSSVAKARRTYVVFVLGIEDLEFLVGCIPPVKVAVLVIRL
jgi:hypothetical protein